MKDDIIVQENTNITVYHSTILLYFRRPAFLSFSFIILPKEDFS